MMRELRINRRYARSLLHEFKRFESLHTRRLREALARRKKRLADYALDEAAGKEVTEIRGLKNDRKRWS